MNDAIKAALDAFIARQQAFFAEQEKDTSPRIPRTLIAYEVGQRYARIFTYAKDEQGKDIHRSAFGFMDIATGDLLKSAGWKGPAKNFARGNVLTIGTKLFRYSIS